MIQLTATGAAITVRAAASCPLAPAGAAPPEPNRAGRRGRQVLRQRVQQLLAAGPWASKEFVERFRREAQNAARMQHPNIVAIYEVGSAEELHFFSMRLIHGMSLAAVIKRDGKLAPLRAASLLRTIAEAVDYAHRLGTGREQSQTRVGRER